MEFKLPDIGENIESGDVVAVLVSEGDTIQAGQNVIELETDKAVIEVPCSQAGKVTRIHVKTGDTIPIGGVILTIEAESGAAMDAPSQVATSASAVSEPAAVGAAGESPPGRTGTTATNETSASSISSSDGPEGGSQETPTRIPPSPPSSPSLEPRPATPPESTPIDLLRPAPAGPATRRLARELGVDLHAVSGSGSGGRITEDDVRAYVRQLSTATQSPSVGSMVPPPLPDFSQWGPVDRKPMSGIRRKTAAHLSLAWQLVPHVTQFDLADITDLEAGRKRYGQNRPDLPGKVTMTVLAVKAVVAVLKEFPQFNASIDTASGQIIYKRYYHIGVAVDTERGLIVPVIRDVNRKSVRELAAELDELAIRARERKIELAQLRGGTFTITNLGGIAGTAFTPIINYPEVAILGLARSRQEYVIRDGKAEIRLMLPLCLSYDHRLIDGADAARFIRQLSSVLSDPVQLLLDG